MRGLLADMLWRESLRLIRAGTAGGSLVWAWTLLVEGYQFDRPSYRELAKLAPQAVWGYAFLAVGLLQLYRAVKNTPVSEGFYACVAGALICGLWSYVAFAIAISLDPMPAMNIGNIVVAAMSGVVLIRAIARHE